MSKANVVLVPRLKFTVSVQCSFHVFKATHSEKIIVNIVSPSPRQLHRQARTIGNRHRFCSKVVHGPSAKRSTHARQRDIDIVLLDAK